MKRFVSLFGALAVALGVAVPIALSDDGGGTAKAPTVTCSRTVFVAGIVRVGIDALSVRPGESDSPKAIIVRLDDETLVKRGDTVVGRSALAAGKRARFSVRACRSDDRRVLTAKVITLRPDPPAAPSTRPSAPSTEPTPTPETCGQGEMDTVLIAVSATSITVRTSSSEGVKDWPITVNGDTIVRKSDETVSLSVLKPGDHAHVVLVRCPSGSVRALRIVFIPTTVTPPSPADTCTNAEGNVTLVSIGTSVVNVSTSATDGTGSPVTVNGDTVIRKNDQNVALSALAPGDVVRIAIVRCTSGSVKARSIVFLRSATPTT